MNLDNAERLIATLPSEALVLDVGGGASPFPRADYVIDALPFHALGGGSDGNAHQRLKYPPRYGQERWIQVDLCDRQPWPVADKSFDYVVCSHLLEDIRDPIWVCSELQRVAKAGYIEVPSRYVEQSKGLENPRHAGFYHHRWLITEGGGGLEFRHKPHVLHSVNDAIVAWLRPGTAIHPKYSIVSFEWQTEFTAREMLEFDENAVIDELCAFARHARDIPDLVCNVPMSLAEKIKRKYYYWRLAQGWR